MAALQRAAAALLLFSFMAVYGEALLLAKVFTTHAVLQRDVPVPVWGFMSAGTAVDLSFNGRIYSATADATGLWIVTLPATPAGGPYVISANASDGTVQSITDVLFGEVILCGGQSNVRRAGEIKGSSSTGPTPPPTPPHPKKKFRGGEMTEAEAVEGWVYLPAPHPISPHPTSGPDGHDGELLV